MTRSMGPDRIGRSGAGVGYTPSAFHWQPGAVHSVSICSAERRRAPCTGTPSPWDARAVGLATGSCRPLWRFVRRAKREFVPQQRVASVVTRDSSRVRPRVPAQVAAALGRGMNPTLRLQPRRFRRCVTTRIRRRGRENAATGNQPHPRSRSSDCSGCARSGGVPRSSSRTPLPSRMLCRARSMRRRNRGSCSNL